MLNNLTLADGECTLPSGYVINPLKLQDSINFDDTESILQSSTRPTILYNHTNHIRTTRDTEKVVNTRTIIDKDGHRHRVVAMVKFHLYLIEQVEYSQNF